MSTSLDLAERLSTVVATQQEIATTALDRGAIMDVTCRRAVDLSGSFGAMVELFDGSDVVCGAAHGSLASLRGTRSPAETSLTQVCIREGEVLRCDDTECDGRTDSRVCRRLDARSLVVVPLTFRNKVTGGLIVTSPRAAFFNDLDAYALRLIGGIAGAALSHAAEYEEKKASEARFRLLFERNVAGAFRSTTGGRFLECNDALAHMFGYTSAEELGGIQTWDLYETRAAREDYLAELKRAGSVTAFPLRLRRKDGSMIDVVANADILQGEGDEGWVLGTVFPKEPSRA